VVSKQAKGESAHEHPGDHGTTQRARRNGQHSVGVCRGGPGGCA
jgi:hypothetical protein